jgi:hypothetical protein
MAPSTALFEVITNCTPPRHFIQPALSRSEAGQIIRDSFGPTTSIRVGDVLPLLERDWDRGRRGDAKPAVVAKLIQKRGELGSVVSYEAVLNFNAQALREAGAKAELEQPVLVDLEAGGVLRLKPALMGKESIIKRPDGSGWLSLAWFRSSDDWLKCPHEGEAVYALDVVEVGRGVGIRLKMGKGVGA